MNVQPFSLSLPTAVRLLHLVVACVVALLLPLASSFGVASAQAPTVTVTPETVYLGDTVTVDIEVTNARRVRFGAPEGNDLRLVGQRSFSSQSYVNGQAAFSHRLALQLQPVRVGSLSTGRIPYQTEAGLQFVEAVTVMVLDPSERGDQPDPAAQARPSERPVRAGTTRAAVPELDRIPSAPPLQDASMFHGTLGTEDSGAPFLAAWVSTDAAMPGQQILVDYLLFSPAGGFGFEITGMSEPLFTGAWFEDISEQRIGSIRSRFAQTANVNNQLFEVRPIRSYILIPLEQGNLNIPALQLDMQAMGFGRGAAGTLSSTPLQIPVNALPRLDDGTPVERAPVGFLQMTARVDRDRLRVGDSGAILLDVSGVAHFTALAMPDAQPPSGIRLFAPEDNTQSRYGATGWLEGSVSRRIPFVADQEGTWTIPAMTLRYYDPWRQTWTTRTTDPIEIVVEGVNDAAVAAANEGSGTTEDWRDALPSPRVVSQPREHAHSAGAWPWVWTGIIGFPPLIWLGLLAFAGANRVRQSSQPARQSKAAALALSEALHSAADAGDSQSLLTAIRRYFGELNRQHSLAHPLTHDGMVQTATDLQNPTATELAHLHAEIAAQRYSGETTLTPAQVSAAKRLAQAARGGK